MSLFVRRSSKCRLLNPNAPTSSTETAARLSAGCQPGANTILHLDQLSRRACISGRPLFKQACSLLGPGWAVSKGMTDGWLLSSRLQGPHRTHSATFCKLHDGMFSHFHGPGHIAPGGRCAQTDWETQAAQLTDSISATFGIAGSLLITRLFRGCSGRSAPDAASNYAPQRPNPVSHLPGQLRGGSVLDRTHE